MKVVALLSGGKDSCFNMMHCIANGHDIVALATLVPEEGKDEIDSYMYQSVGTTLIPLLAESMRLPLYTQVIRGKPLRVGGTYGSRTTPGGFGGGKGREEEQQEEEKEKEGGEGDETEDLEVLLRTVKSHHPEIAGLSSGAILSTYQRSRIEHITSRPHISLTPLSFLWQQPERPLVLSMLSSGLEPVLVKVAGMGLEVEDVGRKLGEERVKGKLRRLERDWGCHFAGEGGEYETVCTDGPLFYDRVVFDETETIITDPSPVAHLRVIKAHLEPKVGHVVPNQEEMRRLLGLDSETATTQRNNLEGEDREEDVENEGEVGVEEETLLHANVLDWESRQILRAVRERQSETSSDPFATPALEGDLQRLQFDEKQMSSNDVVELNRRGRWFGAVVELTQQEGEEVGVLMRRHFDALRDALRKDSLDFPLIQHINLYLARMSDFPLVNAEYIKYFGSEPPTRACVGVHLDARAGQVCRLEAVGWDDKREERTRRSGLHVQGLSYWAPANIGPYSQGVVSNNRLTIAGQIPLLPRTLTFATPRDVLFDAVLALQHVRRIIEVMGDSSKGGAGSIGRGWIEGVVGWYVGDEEVERAMRAVWDEFAERHACRKTPVLFVAARELPKGASVEWQVTRHTGDSSWPVIPRMRGNKMSGDESSDDDDDGDDDTARVQVAYTRDAARQSSESYYGDAFFSIHTFQDEVIKAASGFKLKEDMKASFSTRLFYLHRLGSKASEVAAALTASSGVRVSLVPVARITNHAGQPCNIALVMTGSSH
ncbi:hypothetical protein HD553DRAFT_122492 [Filobasidium floriforme]|uniref:uncharacterized protein n=1 Tax=Filobasidium floriforme TaxID=5210 RepID=UPI001E8D1879|nr:uncharacterized protein HD553DRAFT_122492 [Filobasidium floriforme]KAH8080204.1 hypothetical protein HD553DRAFT_122492 [Filobasidium floriforme]